MPAAEEPENNQNSKQNTIDRHSFLRGAAAAGAAATAASASVKLAAADTAGEAGKAAEKTKALAKLPSATFITHPGSGFTADVLNKIGLQYKAINPAPGFRSPQGSIINHLGNKNPEIITCLHEETATAMAHGYAKASSKPMGIMVHGTVGLQHASMALYNAWCDRVPMLMFNTNGIDRATPRPGVGWIHSAQNPAAVVREFIKWDDPLASLQHFAESTVRARQFTMTSPVAPAFVALDMDLQEEEIEHAKNCSSQKFPA